MIIKLGKIKGESNQLRNIIKFIIPVKCMIAVSLKNNYTFWYGPSPDHSLIRSIKYKSLIKALLDIREDLK